MILVTGATGMTGKFVVQELNRRKIPVRMLVRQESVEKVTGLDGEVVIGDLSDFTTLHRAMDGVSGVAHVACTFTDIAIDAAAMGVLIDGWQDGPFVFVSSLDVYGLTEKNPVTEAHPLSESYGEYGRGKVICERMLTAKAESVGSTDFAQLRAPHIIGPHSKGKRFLRKIEQNEPITLPGSAPNEWSQYRDAWTDVRDLAWVIAESLSKPVGGPLNVLTDHFVWYELYTTLIELTNSSSQIIHKSLTDMDEEEQKAFQTMAQSWNFDNSKLRQELGFRPQFTLEQTLRDMVESTSG